MCNIVYQQVDRYTSRYASPVLCSRELSALRDADCIPGLTVRASPAAREVQAGYSVGDTSMQLTIALPANLPLGQITVSGDERRAGVQKAQWRRWILQLTVFLTYQVRLDDAVGLSLKPCRCSWSDVIY